MSIKYIEPFSKFLVVSILVAYLVEVVSTDFNLLDLESDTLLINEKEL